jgi:hypothetical protein
MIPNIRTRLLSLVFCQEYKGKLEEYEAAIAAVETSLLEIKNPKVLRTLEV